MNHVCYIIVVPSVMLVACKRVQQNVHSRMMNEVHGTHSTVEAHGTYSTHSTHDTPTTHRTQSTHGACSTHGTHGTDGTCGNHGTYGACSTHALMARMVHMDLCQQMCMCSDVHKTQKL